MPSTVKAFNRPERLEVVENIASDSQDNLVFDEDTHISRDVTGSSDSLDEEYVTDSSSDNSLSQLHDDNEIVKNDDEEQKISHDHESDVTRISQSFKFKRKFKVALYIYNFLKRVKQQLIMVFKCFITTLIVLTTLQISFPQSVHRIVPKPFFPPQSLVKDYYTGDLHQLAEHLQFSDLAFVMYYAPWDRECVQAINHFSAAARTLQTQVLFAAINCWQPDSSCRANHKVSKFPTIVLHINTGLPKGPSSTSSVLRESRAVAYSGPLNRQHFVRFLTKALNPYMYVDDRRRLASLQLLHTGIVLTHIDGTNSEDVDLYNTAEEQFASLYRASLHWLEYDKRSELAWGVITDSKLAKDFGLISNSSTEIKNSRGNLPLFKLVLIDSMVAYNGTLKLNNDPRPLLEWVSNKLTASDNPSWFEVSNGKSLVLSRIFEKGPTLVVFSPDQPYEKTNILFDITRGLWLEYNWCPTSRAPNYTNTRQSLRSDFLLKTTSRYSALIEMNKHECSKFMFSSSRRESFEEYSDHESDSTLTKTSNIESTNADCFESHPACHRFLPFFAQSGGFVWSLVDGACQSLFGYNLVSPCDSSKSSQCKNSDGSMNVSLSNKAKKHPQITKRNEKSIRDERVLETIMWWKDNDCHRNDILQDSHHRYEKLLLSSGRERVSFAGKGCDNNLNNKTLYFVVLDSANHYEIAERWGIKLNSDLTGAAIVDLDQEIHYTLNGPLNSNSLSLFLYNYSSSILSRELVSKEPLYQYLEDYSDEIKEESVSHTVYSSMRKLKDAQKFLNNNQENKGSPKVETRGDSSFVSIVDLTSEQFMNLIEATEQNLFVLFHSRNCVHCTSASHIMLTVASYFKDGGNDTSYNRDGKTRTYSDNLLFARIDVTANTLPWNVNFASLPAFIFYPANSRANSRVFDVRLPLTTNSLLRFLTAQLPPTPKLRLGIEGCNIECVLSVDALLPRRIASTTHQLMLATARHNRVYPDLMKYKLKSDQKLSSEYSNKYWTLDVEEKLVMKNIKQLRKDRHYLLLLEDWFSSQDFVRDNNSDSLYRFSSLKKILKTFLKLNNS